MSTQCRHPTNVTFHLSSIESELFLHTLGAETLTENCTAWLSEDSALGQPAQGRIEFYLLKKKWGSFPSSTVLFKSCCPLYCTKIHFFFFLKKVVLETKPAITHKISTLYSWDICLAHTSQFGNLLLAIYFVFSKVCLFHVICLSYERIWLILTEFLQILKLRSI